MQSRAPHVFIVATVALDAIGIGLVLPVMPALIGGLRGAGIGDAALWGGLLAFSYAAMQFLFGPLLGNLSDRFGRRPVLVTSVAVMGLNYLVMALAPGIALLFAARILSGIAGATQPTASAYLADLSARGARSASFGLVGAAFGLGFIMGPALGGLLGELGPRAPFWAAGAVSLATAGLMAAFLPESLPPARRRPFVPARANPFRAIARMRALPDLGGLLAADLLFRISNNVYPAIWSFFTIARFGWSPGMVGASLAAFGIASALVQGWGIRVLLARLGQRRTALFGLMAHVAGLSLLTFASAGWMIFALMPLIALAVVTGPAVTGMMSDRVDEAAQGELQGVLASLNAVAVIVSPLAMTGVFHMATREGAGIWMPGAPFAVAAVLAVAALVLTRHALAARTPAPAR